MFGLTFDKLAIIAILAVFILGPERLPLYAGRLAELIRGLRDLTDSAKSRLKEEMGPEINDIDWKKLDPRQYDPRRIVREALADDGAPSSTADATRASDPTHTSAAADATHTSDASDASDEPGVPVPPPAPRLRAGSDGRYRPA